MKLSVFFLTLLIFCFNQSKQCQSALNDERNKLPPFHNPYFFPNRSGIVHLFEWKFLDIARECEEYLGPNGFAAVQVSPVSENIILTNRPWYERYQPVSYEIRTRSGNAKEFSEMTERCRAAGIRIYVDVVINHMTSNLSGHGTGGAIIDAYNFKYPLVPYDRNDFNQPTCQINNYDDPTELRNCELGGLHDLNQSKENVRWSIILFLDKLMALGATGFRVDASKHMWPNDLQYIYNHIKYLPEEYGFQSKSQPFIYQEVQGNMKHDYSNLGVVTEFTYSAVLAEVFRNKKSIIDLKDLAGKSWHMLSNESALIFIDNHDLQRQSDLTLSYKEPKIFKAAYAFALAHNYGIPRIMSSYHFDNNDDGPPHDTDFNILGPEFNETGFCSNGWICEHRWPAIRNMIQFRNTIGNSSLDGWWSSNDGETIAFCRENKGFFLLNSGNVDFAGEIQTCLPEGVYCNVMVGILENGKCGKRWKIAIDKKGKGYFLIDKNSVELAIALHINAKEY